MLFWRSSMFLIVFLLRAIEVKSNNKSNGCQVLQNAVECREFWSCTVDKLLQNFTSQVHRAEFSDLDIRKIGHTPMWLRISSRKLHCVIHPQLQRKKFRMKVYRALHYINRINRIMKDEDLAIPDDTEWWTHHSDLVKIPENSNFLPVFSVAGASGYKDIPGIPFMSFSDRIAEAENTAFEEYSRPKLKWTQKSEIAFFRGSLSDCGLAVERYKGDINYCPRAKVIFEAKRTKNPLLRDVHSIDDFRARGLNLSCRNCTSAGHRGKEFIDELLSHKYLLNFDGAGRWSRRKQLLLRSGGAIFNAEGTGYQFYDYMLKPGVHYIPFDPEVGKHGAGNLVPRLKWAKDNDDRVKQIAENSENFGRICLEQNSVDNFVSMLMKKYSSYLIGPKVDLPLVDLSPCVQRKKGESISRLCRKIIDKCWK
ncbi:unnamed protein product [Bathycoccus prasinos]